MSMLLDNEGLSISQDFREAISFLFPLGENSLKKARPPQLKQGRKNLANYLIVDYDRTTWDEILNRGSAISTAGPCSHRLSLCKCKWIRQV